MATIAGGLEKIDLAVLEAYRLAFRDPAVRHTFRDYSTVHSGKAAVTAQINLTVAAGPA